MERNYFLENHEEYISNFLGSSILYEDVFLRLKRVKFLGLVNYLEHVPEYLQFSRYDHTLSVAYLSLRLSENLSFSPLEKLITVMAALLHDVGHGPFSHSIEDLLNEKSGYGHSHKSSLALSKIKAILSKFEFLFPTEARKVNGKLANVIYWVINGGLPDNLSQRREFGAVFNPLMWKLFSYLPNIDGFDGDNRAIYVFSELSKVNMKAIDPIELVNALTGSKLGFLVEKSGAQLISKYVTNQEAIYDLIFLSSKVKTAEAMFVRAIELTNLDFRFTKIDDQQVVEYLNKNKKSSQLWEQINMGNLFQELSKVDQKKLGYLTAKSEGLSQLGPSFIAAKKQCEYEFAKMVNVRPEMVILKRYIPYNWKSTNLFFKNEYVPRVNQTYYSINWKKGHGLPYGHRDYEFEIYFPC